jgi:hypothetical protein
VEEKNPTWKKDVEKLSLLPAPGKKFEGIGEEK